MASHPRGKDGRVVYDLEGDFRLDADELRRRFAFYTDEFGIRPEGQKGRRPVKQPLNALIVKEGEGTQDAVAARRRHLHVEGHLQQLPRHHRRRRRADQHRHALRGGGDRAAVRGREQQPAPGDRVHPGPRRPRRWLVAARRTRRRDHRAGEPRRRPRVLAEPAAVLLAPHREALGRAISRNVDRSYQPPEPVVTTTFLDSHAFTLGGRRFELYATPGGETTDSLVVWLPEDRDGVHREPHRSAVRPHPEPLHRSRATRYRSAIAYIHAVDRVIALDPEVLVTGHGEPIRGADEIRRRLLADPRRHAVPPRPHHRGHERRRRPVHADGPGHAAARARHPAGARQGAVDRARGLGGARRLVPLRVDHRALRRPAVRDLGRAHRARGRHRRC